MSSNPSASELVATPEALPSARPEESGAGPSTAGFVNAVIGGVVMGVLVLFFTITFTAILYSGALAGEISRGLGFTLAGATVMSVIGALAVTYRGSIVQPQDATAVILSLAVAGIAAGWVGTADGLFATVVALIALTTAATGFVLWLAGAVRLGFLIRFIPYPVLGGFLAATGFLIMLAAIGLMIGQSLDLWTLSRAVESGVVVRWLPWLGYGAAMAVIVRYVHHWLVLPGCILAGVVAFHALLPLLGLTLADAQAAGLLLGPFAEGGLTAHLGFWVLAEADWWTILRQAPTIAVVAGMAVVGTLLSVSGLGLALDRDIDANRDLRGVGLANLAAAFGGGMVGYHQLMPTLLARALGLRNAVAGFAVCGFALAALFFGAGFLSILPVGVFAGVLVFISIDLLYTWLWEERRRLPIRDYGIVLLILAVAATVGFLEAIGIGLAAAAVLFIVAYSGVDVVRLRASAATLRSRVERPESELRMLAERGQDCLIYRLSGYLFFGATSRLLDELRTRLAEREKRPRYILLDLQRVSGIDSSAAFALGRLARGCTAQDVRLVISGMAPAMRTDFLRALGGDDGPELVNQFDDALRAIEDALLAQGGVPDETSGFLEDLCSLAPGFDPHAWFREASVAAGAVVFEEGAHADGMVLLVNGELRAEATGLDGHPVTVATILPGAVVGEIGLYAGTPRSARVRAETSARLMWIEAVALDRLARAEPATALAFHRLVAIRLSHRLIRSNSILRDFEAV